MATTYQRVHAELTTSLATVYTCPAATSAIILSARASNIDGTVSATFEAKAGASGSTKYIQAVGTPLPVGSSLNMQDGGEKWILEANEILEAKASANGDVDMMLSIAELT